MTTFLLNRRGWMLVLLAGAMPLGTVADCGYSGSGGSLFLNRGGYHGDSVVVVDDGHHHGGGFVDVYVEEDVYYDDYYYDDYYYDDYYYDDYYYEDDYYCDPYFWDCW